MNIKVWSTGDLAKHIGVSDQYIRKQLADGKIEGQKVGRDWIITDDEVKRWLASRQQRKKKT